MTDQAAPEPAESPPAPEPPKPAADWFAISFQGFANSLAARLGGPVYLVGSALTEPGPADIDVRVVLEEHDLLRLFGKDEPERPDGEVWNCRRWKMAREQLKQSRRLSRKMRCNIDFQIQIAAQGDPYFHKPKLRLDRAPEGFFDCGMGDP